MTWLAETPSAVVRAHLVMAGRLEAAESLRRSSEVWVGKHLAAGRRGLRIIAQRNEWSRRADGKGATERATPGALQGLGIGVRVAPRREA